MKKTLFLFAVVLITTSLSITAFSQEKVEYPIQKVELEKKNLLFYHLLLLQQKENLI